MKKAPKRKYANGGELPYKTRAEFDKYYSTNPNYAVMPTGTAGSTTGNVAYYDKTKYNYDQGTGKWSALTPDASTTFGWGGVGNAPKPEHIYSFTQPQNNITPSVQKSVNVDSGRKPVFTGNANYQSFQYPDQNGQYGANATTKHFDKKTGREIDISKSFGQSGIYTPNYLGYAYGGLVKKLGYAWGGAVDPKSATNAAINVGGQVAGMGGQYLQSQAMNDDGTINENKAAFGGALSGGAKGLALGMNPALMAATGGLSAPIGAAGGALIGGIAKYVGADKMNDQINDARAVQEQQQLAAKNNAIQQSALAKQYLERQQGFAKGGEVKGKGTSKSDSINAKVKEGSFVTPAENAHVAKTVKKMIAPKKKDEVADLDQDGGEEVKLSNGEFLFTPEEKDEIINELGEEFLEHLAPNSEHKHEAFREGGLTPAKARIMLHDNQANGQPLTDKQRAYFGLIASGYKCGGMVKGMAEGGDVNEDEILGDPDKLTKYEKSLGKKGPDKKGQRELLRRQYQNIVKDPEREQEANTILSNIKKLDKEIAYQEDLDRKTKEQFENKTTSSSGTGNSKVGTNTFNPTGEASDIEVPSVVNKNKVSFPSSQELLDDPNNKYGESMLSQTARKEQEDFTKAQADKNKSNDNLAKGLGIAASQIGDLGNYFLPYQQYKMGQRYLAQAGDRPKYNIDPDFLNSVTTAQANAKFGFTPEEQSLLNSQNVNALRAGQAAAQNYSGGSNAVALNLTRDALNNYYTRGLQQKLADKNLMYQKQGIANDLVANKTAMGRQIFQDNMNAWQQNQQAGAGLVGAGLKNLMDANRYNQELQFMNKYAQGNNPWQNYNISI